MIDFDFSIQDFMQGILLKSWLSIILRAFGNESNTVDLGEKITIEIHFKFILK